MATSYTRKSLTAALVQVKLSNFDSGLSIPMAADLGFEAEGQAISQYIRESIARAQQISTSDALQYEAVRQMGYGGIVEFVPVITHGAGTLSVVEIINGLSLYKLGIYDFVHYLLTCEKEPLEISILSYCQQTANLPANVTNTNTSGSQTEIDRLPNVRFTGVSREVNVNGQLVINSASFTYIRSLSALMATGARGTGAV